jgi:Glyoxalase/Bleomycin resistance protein/Dioxygenase superfamily
LGETKNVVDLTVGDLERSIEFYTGIFGFPLVAQRQQVAILQTNQAYRSQVLVLRESWRATHPGGGTIGVKVLDSRWRCPRNSIRSKKDLPNATPMSDASREFV